MFTNLLNIFSPSLVHFDLYSLVGLLRLYEQDTEADEESKLGDSNSFVESFIREKNIGDKSYSFYSAEKFLQGLKQFKEIHGLLSFVVLDSR
jgi:hypothetical protein